VTSLESPAAGAGIWIVGAFIDDLHSQRARHFDDHGKLPITVPRCPW
jgi:hypothetical protein